MNDLKPCPFCGSKAAYVQVPGIVGAINPWNVYCTSQDCDTRKVHKELAKAIQAWNKRTTNETD